MVGCFEFFLLLLLFYPNITKQFIGKKCKTIFRDDYSSSPAVHTYLLQLEAGK